jgi:hypothetical protein
VVGTAADKRGDWRAGHGRKSQEQYTLPGMVQLGGLQSDEVTDNFLHEGCCLWDQHDCCDSSP